MVTLKCTKCCINFNKVNDHANLNCWSIWLRERKNQYYLSKDKNKENMS